MLPMAKDKALQAMASTQFLVSSLLRKASSSGTKRQKFQTISYNHPKQLLNPRCQANVEGSRGLSMCLIFIAGAFLRLSLAFPEILHLANKS